MNLTWRAGNVLGFLHFFLLNWPHDNTTRHLVPEQRQPKSNVIKLLSFQGKWMHVNNEVNKEASDESEPGPRGEHGPNLQAGLQNTLAPFPAAFTFLPPWNRPLPKPITHQMETDCALDQRLWTPEISNVDLGQFITIDPSGIKTPQQLNLTLGDLPPGASKSGQMVSMGMKTSQPRFIWLHIILFFFSKSVDSQIISHI